MKNHISLAITGKHSNEEYSYGGAFNISNKFKTASSTLKVDYRVKLPR